MNTPTMPLLTVCGIEGVFTDGKGAGPQSCDVACAKLFCKVGGKLAVFSTRAPAAVQQIVGRDVVSLPAVTCGGALLYDLNRDCMVQARPISVQAGRTILDFVLSELPRTGVVGVSDRAATCMLASSSEAQALLDREGGAYQMIPPEDAGRSWCKLSICGPQDEVDRMKTYLSIHHELPVNVLRQDDNTVELVTAQVQPGEGLRTLCRLAGCMEQQAAAVIAEPDELSWADGAGELVVMGDAAESLRSHASEVLESRCQGGLGQYLYCRAALKQGDL